MIRKVRWSAPEGESYSTGDFQADCLGDLVTHNNTLCLWHVEDDFSNLDDVIVALAATRDNVANLDYTLLQRDVVQGIGELSSTPGESPYEKANNQWHYELRRLSAVRVLDLAKRMLSGATKGRKQSKDIKAQLKNFHDKRKLDPRLLKPKMRVELGIDPL